MFNQLLVCFIPAGVGLSTQCMCVPFLNMVLWLDPANVLLQIIRLYPDASVCSEQIQVVECTLGQLEVVMFCKQANVLLAAH